METEERIDYRKANDETLYAMRQMVIKLWKSKARRDKIEELTGFSKHTVGNIITTYKKQGLAGLKPMKRGRKKGTNCKLTPDEEKQIIATMVDHDPAQLKLKCCMWTRKTVHDFILREFGKDVPIRTIGEYLHRWGFTVQRPAKRAIKQDDKAVQAWLKEEFPAIKEKAKQEKAEIFWGDETAVQNEANYARGYAPKGQTPVLKIQTVKMHINMVSAISNRGKLHFLLYSDAMNADRMIHFMEALIKDIPHKIFFIIDNLKVHHSNKVKEWVEAHQDRIALFFLPPYSPEYNPDEYLNHDLKQSVGSQQQAVKLSDIEENTKRFMENLKADEEHVQSYFDHPKVKGYKD